MPNIWDKVQLNPSERPKYTRFELAKLVQERRNELGLSLKEISNKYGVEESFWRSIENASRAFNVKIYKLIGEFLNMSKDEMLAIEVDDMSSLSFRTSDENHPEIQEAIEFANIVFDEMVMQEKFATK
ncbi:MULTISPECIES: helix-turn-helix transcriptional regulator [unclassified Virgibacillus]|uniref:helix-turn-helix domain-containing protein n=1 Tax=unclassified Virgibacillus TaxID=2620237 RepID=UPI000420A114|nr:MULTISPECIES: helix-turn-helix transcriptional regulator [Bacillaceae]MDY7046703.1 helix-turn-helix transcriptional regulator [Virgibacillus sp. M23]